MASRWAPNAKSLDRSRQLVQSFNEPNTNFPLILPHAPCYMDIAVKVSVVLQLSAIVGSDPQVFKIAKVLEGVSIHRQDFSCSRLGQLATLPYLIGDACRILFLVGITTVDGAVH